MHAVQPRASSSPPDIECAICAVEGTANMHCHCGRGIPHPKLGLIHGDILLKIKDSKIVEITGEDQAKSLPRFSEVLVMILFIG